MVNYGERASGTQSSARGLGDPMTVARESRPTTHSLSRWARDLNGEPERIELCGRILDSLTDEDLATWGHARAEIEAELDAAAAEGGKPRKRPLKSPHAGAQGAGAAASQHSSQCLRASGETCADAMRRPAPLAPRRARAWQRSGDLLIFSNAEIK